MRSRVTAVFTLSALVLGISAGAIIWGISRAYLIDVRQQTGIRQAQASAAAIGRLLSPEDPDLPRQAQEFAGVNESGVLITRGSRVLASAGLGPQQIPARLRQLIDSGESARQRVRVNGEVQLIVGIPLATGASYYQSLPFRRVDNALRTLTVAMLAAGAAGLVLNALWARAATRRALRPVDELTAAARAVARGELGTRMPEHDRDLAQVARVFNTTTADLERRVRADARFASNVSHELRTPLTTITNAVAVLDRRRAQLPDVAREAVDLLSSQVRRFERLVLDLLDLSVITEGDTNLALEEVDLRDFVRRLAVAEGWGRVSVPDEAVTVVADSLRLERIVSNLVANARTHGEGLVRLAVSRRDARAVIEVDDAGPGVPEPDREVIFERFVHRPTRSGQRDRGSGLGLALVAQLTALHRGRVRVEDRPGGGARFVVELPLGQSEDVS